MLVTCTNEISFHKRALRSFEAGVKYWVGKNSLVVFEHWVEGNLAPPKIKVIILNMNHYNRHISAHEILVYLFRLSRSLPFWRPQKHWMRSWYRLWFRSIHRGGSLSNSLESDSWWAKGPVGLLDEAESRSPVHSTSTGRLCDVRVDIVVGENWPHYNDQSEAHTSALLVHFVGLFAALLRRNRL